ncbi:MAG: phosphoribosylamine--glycine ligase [Chitinophagaceae bacterium]|nr:phosphoribosylamine--glycine ligase [Chitinophagaceae bacterium]
MNILLLGSGGREHALAWKIRQSPLCDRLFIAPGNAGTALEGENVSLDILDFPEVGRFCLSQGVGMVVVGPEEPLVRGIRDHFAGDAALQGVILIGPSAAAAQLEGSKAFAKAFMMRHGIPTAGYRAFDKDSYAEGVAYIRSHPLPVVLKADGLAAGKGVVIAHSHIEAIAEFELMIQYSKFGEASRRVVVEEFLSGIELSVFVLTDGKSYVVLPEAKDYKRIGEGDTGLNTGGMGAVSPVPFADDVFMDKVRSRIIEPTVRGIEAEGIDYHGFVFIGLIKVDGEPFVIEYNCRMGDPETEVVMPRLKNDLVALFRSVADGSLGTQQIETDPRSVATVMLVSGGYPGSYVRGLEIDGLEVLKEDDVLVFHAGTSAEGNRVLTNGGRVLAVSAYGRDIPSAVRRSLNITEFIQFDGMYHRRDIGYEFRS